MSSSTPSWRRGCPPRAGRAPRRVRPSAHSRAGTCCPPISSACWGPAAAGREGAGERGPQRLPDSPTGHGRVDSQEGQSCAQAQGYVPRPSASPSSRKPLCPPAPLAGPAPSPGSTPPPSVSVVHLLLPARCPGQGLANKMEQLNLSIPQVRCTGKETGAQATHRRQAPQPLTVRPDGSSGPQAWGSGNQAHVCSVTVSSEA